MLLITTGDLPGAMPEEMRLCPRYEIDLTMQKITRLAAVDLGSNSFRLEIGRVEGGQFYRTEYLKETVRQGGGLDETRTRVFIGVPEGSCGLRGFRRSPISGTFCSLCAHSLRNREHPSNTEVRKGCG